MLRTRPAAVELVAGRVRHAQAGAGRGGAARAARIVPPIMDAAPSVFDRVFPLTVLLLLGLAIPAALLAINRLGSRFAVGERARDPGKHEPYECGLSRTVGGASDRFPVKFYLVAMLFLAFDVEVAFLYPWALQFRAGGWEMLWLLVAFLVILEVAYLYLWRKGALDWER